MDLDGTLIQKHGLKTFWLDEPGICYEYVKNLAEAFETTDGVIAEITGDIPEQ